MQAPVDIVIGFDQREAIAYHVFCQSILEKTSLPVRFTPLTSHAIPGYVEHHADGSNAFTYTRFLVPFLMSYEGWAIFADGDMICHDDIKSLWNLRDSSKAVQVAKHNYVTKSQVKYLGNKNLNYPRKNWSSLVLWNCGHPANKQLSLSFVREKDGAFLHRFSWLSDDLIGDLPLEWNWLVTEYPDNPNAKLLHYTLGTPCFRDYQDSDLAEHWHSAFKRATQGLE